jgi:thiaminase/transcriptional activator TenA
MSHHQFYDQLRNQNNSLWRAIFEHPFVKGIGDGSLSRDRYEFFLKQDYVYLIDFSRVFALASAKAQSLEDMGYFATLLEATLNIEMDLHRKTCREFGISNDDLEATQKGMITSAYTNLLLRTCYEGNIQDIMAVLLPCAAGYVEIGGLLKNQGLPENKYYRDWINTYSSDEFKQFADWLIDKMNRFAEKSSEEDRARWMRSYRSSARFEYLFFEMSWKKEDWPQEIQVR